MLQIIFFFYTYICGTIFCKSLLTVFYLKLKFLIYALGKELINK